VQQVHAHKPQMHIEAIYEKVNHVILIKKLILVKIWTFFAKGVW
jgi:hypothetical protein